MSLRTAPAHDATTQLNTVDQYPLLLTPGNVVSITDAMLWGKQPFSATEWVTY